MTRLRIFTCGLLFFFSLAGCSSGTETVSTTEEGKKVIEKDLFSIQIPAGWEILPDEALKKGEVAFGAREARGLGLIESTIVVHIQDSISNVPLDRFVIQSLEVVRKNSQNYRKISEEKKDIDGTPTLIVEYTDRNSIDLSQLRYYALFLEKNGKIITATAVCSDDRTDEEKNSFKNILFTLRPKG